MVAVSLVVSGFVLLGVSAARHLRWRDTFTVQLDAQGLWPTGSAGRVAWGVIVLEAVVGAGGVLALSAGWSASAIAPLLWALVVVGTAFVGLQTYLLVQAPDAPCGCDPTSDAQVGLGTLVKAAWPVVAGVVGLLALPTEGLDALSLAAAVGAVTVGLALAWLVDSVPALLERR